MCHLCNTKPVYEFTNKRKLCKTCYIRWFEKKVFYTIRKFAMLKKGDVVGFVKGNDFRSVVLGEVLKMLEGKRAISLFVLGESKKSKIDKIALPETIDSTASKIVNNLINFDFNSSDELKPVNKQVIKPLYLFLDKEVELYARLKGLKFRKKKNNAHLRSQIYWLDSKINLRNLASKIYYRDNRLSAKNRVERRFEATNNRATLERGKLDFNKIIDFIDGLERKHPEIKRAIVNGLEN